MAAQPTTSPFGVELAQNDAVLNTLFLLIAVANMVFASWTTFYGPRWMLVITVVCSMVAWVAVFLSAGQPPSFGLLAGLPWSTMLVGIGWFLRHYDENGAGHRR